VFKFTERLKARLPSGRQRPACSSCSGPSTPTIKSSLLKRSTSSLSPSGFPIWEIPRTRSRGGCAGLHSLFRHIKALSSVNHEIRDSLIISLNTTLSVRVRFLESTSVRKTPACESSSRRTFLASDGPRNLRVKIHGLGTINKKAITIALLEEVVKVMWVMEDSDSDSQRSWFTY
jgi:hypothetical protein